ncbi:MAG: PIG-L family deacetylase [Candidatus Acidiferrales bacterium]
MKTRWYTNLAAAAAAIIFFSPAVRAQSVAQVVDAIDHARITTRVLYVTAHPDDEHAAVLTYLSKGLGDDVALCSTTRGEGGQNAIGPELGPALKVLRTDELYRATQDYGAELFFTRAPDFGFSKSADETLRIWNGIGKEDLVRVIRTFRPNIIINQWGGVHSGHGQHQATGIITPQAAEAAADPTQYPEQLKEGLRPWTVEHVLQYARNGEENQEGVVKLPIGDISPLWGESYANLAMVGFANHRSQGITRVLDSPFFSRPVSLIDVQGGKITQDDFTQSLFSIAKESNQLEIPLGTADGALAAARQAALRLDWTATVKYLANAGKELQKATVEAQASTTIDKNVLWELRQQRQKIDDALAEAAALHLDAEADQNALVAGGNFSVRVTWSSRGDVGVDLAAPSLEIPQGWMVTPTAPKTDQQASISEISFQVGVPSNAMPPVSPQDAILPWAPPLVETHITGTADGYTFSIEKPVISRDYTSTTVETMPLELVPAVTLTVDPQQIMLPVNRSTKTFQLFMRVSYHGTTPAQVTAGVDAPQGWTVESVAPIAFPGAGDRLVRFAITPPAAISEAAYDLKPYARLGGQTFATSYEALPSLPSRHVSEPVVATAHVLDLTIPQHLRVGYVAAGIDPVPQSLQQLGIDVDMLDEAALAFGNLSQYDAIVVGIRAYELRPDLMSANNRLLDYVQRGGTLVVQYERDFAWNKLLPAPFPATEGKPIEGRPGQYTSADRITDETSPVRFVDPASPLLNFPNRITQDDFNDWIQERGLYFWGQWASKYQAVLAMHDPGEQDTFGGLVYAHDGKGIYIYTGLAFFRQLPAGVPGAYRLFVNLLSASKAGAAAQ